MNLTFTLKDAIDILFVAIILYGTFRILKRSGAVNLFWGILAFMVAWFLVSFVFQLEVTGALFDRIIAVGAIALIIIFQNEIRTFFYRLGSNMNRLSKRFKNPKDEAKERVIREVVAACQHMSQTKTGALIVFMRSQDLAEFADTGERLDANVSTRMIENIFFKNTPLHDGALFIRQNRLYSAACILPISTNQELPKRYGLRHRAALGITERTDAVAVVVSEETGQISLAENDKMVRVTAQELLTRLFLMLA